jgi:hypothetical protein
VLTNTKIAQTNTKFAVRSLRVSLASKELNALDCSVELLGIAIVAPLIPTVASSKAIILAPSPFAEPKTENTTNE